MKKIICIRKCYDGKRVWDVDQVATVSDDHVVTKHFRLESEPAPVKIIPKMKDIMAPVTLKPNQPVVPVGGMAAGMKLDEVKPMVTAGSEAIRKANEAKKQETSVLQPIIKTRGRPRKT